MSSSKQAKPELLLPSGTFQHLKYAFAFGADAIYAGQPRYSLRARNNEFKLEQIKEGIAIARGLGKKFYVASNIIPHNSKVKTYINDMYPIMDLKPDALIMADPGLIMMVKENWPDTQIHLSVQANTTNYASVKFWHKIGISRVILSRELSFDEITEIKQQCPEMELEVFVHGALCIAYSGRCLLSGYFNHRDPNQGTCTNACRWQYKVHDTQITDTGDVVPIKSVDTNTQQKTYLIEDVTKPNEFMPIVEDENGTYIMNSKDLRAIEHIEKLVKIGVNSFKVEGRTKSEYYVARVAQAYRQAIDDAYEGKSFNYNLISDLDNLANRGYTDGFFERHHSHEYQNYIDSYSKSRQSQYVGVVLSVDDHGYATVEVKNKFSIGDTLDIIHPSGNATVVINKMLSSKDDQEITVAQGSGIFVKIPNMHNMQDALIARVF